MHIRRCTSPGDAKNAPCAGLTSCAIPEARSDVSAKRAQKGVSTQNALSAERLRLQKQKDTPHWYTLRCTYGREKLAHDYMAAQGIKVFHPTVDVVKLINGKRRTVTISRLPNIFFAFGTEETIKYFVYDNANLPYLRFYYRHVHVGNRIEKTPMIVPDHQMNSLQIICATDAGNTIVSLSAVPKFQTGQLVRVTDGSFKGVVGRVARWQGQQRVAVIVDGLVTACTAYVPSAFLEKV